MSGLRLGHLGGIPIEETLALCGPALLLACGAVTATIRARFRALRWRGAAKKGRTRRAAIAALGLATLGLSVGVAVASPAGDLDPSFDGDGRLILPLDGTPTVTLVQPDGKIVLVGYGNSGNFNVHRLNQDGSLDGSFGGDGTAAADFGGNDSAYAAALQPDGRIVLAGASQTPDAHRGAVARFDPDGSLDQTFDAGGADGDGRKLLSGLDSAAAVLVDPGGRIVLAGQSGSHFGILRLNGSGAHDGTEFEPAPIEYTSYAIAAALAPSGRIVLAGAANAFGSPGWRTAIAVYEPGGALDKTFAGTGKRTLGPGAPSPAEKVLVQPDGKILVAGDSGAAETRMLVTRVEAAGTVDASFGAGGTATADFAGQEDLGDAILAPDGRIFLVGVAESISVYAFAVARLTPGGMLDTRFGDGGLTTVSFGPPNLGYSGALQPDGKLVVAGLTVVEGLATRMAVARLLGDPSPAADGGGGPGGSAATPSVSRCAGKRATILGTARGERLAGTRRADVIVALGGNDVIRALGGNDLVCAGAGNDLVMGGRGRDTLYGEAGRDRLLGGPARDRLLGGPGHHWVAQ